MSWLKYKVVDGYAVGIFENGKEMLFDIEDLEKVSAYPWHIDNAGYPGCYAEKKMVRLHRFLIPEVADGMVIDHINRNKLDNRRENLRICTQKENVRNSPLQRNNTSGVAGVFFDKKVGRWRAQVYKNKKTVHVGIFDDYEDAVTARKNAEKELR